jgi:hypothetical protein
VRHHLVVSFDLYAFPPDGPQSVDEIHGVMEAEEERLAAGESDSDELPAPPGPEIERFLAELEACWPSLGADPDTSPWASWPLWQPVSRGTALNIVWSQADSMRPAVIALGQQCNVVIYDPQSDEVFVPAGEAPKRNWFKRRS